MKLISIPILIAFLMISVGNLSSTLAQEQKPAQEQKKEEAAPDVRRFQVKLFETKHHDPNFLRSALFALGSGAKGTEMQANNHLNTLTVRDYPENIAAIEEALKRLDVPNKAPISLECQLHLIAASMTPSEKSPVPKNLDPVLEQLKSTLKFTNYRYVSSALNRVRDGGKIESSGMTGPLFPTPSGVMNTPDNPTFYNYSLANVKLVQDTTGKETVQIDLFKFGVKIPIRISALSANIQYQDVGINTPLSLREGEMAVVGTANISGTDEAMIVVISVKKSK